MKTLLAVYLAYMAVVLAYSVVRRSGRPFRRHLLYQGLILGAALMILPFYWMVISSLKTGAEAMAYPPTWWPSSFEWSNYREAWNKPEVGFGQYYWVSTSTTIVMTTGTLFTAILAAFAFAKMQFPGKSLFFYMILATLMVPGQVLIIPNYIILAKLAWLDTYKALIIPWLASVFSIFLLRQFFMTIPLELSEAARMDGANEFQIYRSVVMPLATPVLASVGLFTFLATWNDFLGPLIYLNSPESYTLSLGLAQFRGEHGVEWGAMMAVSTVMLIPVLIAFFFTQRTFVQGISMTGIKG